VKIALISDAVHPWSLGGKETNLHQIIQQLMQKGDEVDVYTMMWWGRNREYIYEGVTYRAICKYLPLYKRERRSQRQAFMFSISMFRTILELKKYEIVLTDQVPNLHLFTLRIVTKILKKPLFIIWNEFWGKLYWQQYLGPINGRFAARIERASLFMGDVIISISKQTTRRIEKLVSNRQEIQTLDLPIIVAKSADKKFPVEYDVCYAGRLVSHKRVDVLIRAIGLLVKRGSPYRLAIGGNGPEMAALTSLVQSLGLTSQVTFLGDLGSSQGAQELMLRSKLLVSPSEREGFGLSVAEAIAHGLPVVVSDHDDNAARYLVQDGVNGTIAKASNTESFAAAIKYWLEDVDYQSKSIIKVVKQNSQTSWEDVAGHLQAIFRDYLQKK
jgi:glycosyltransferase involved in cell wall biosynthesis